MQVRDPLYRERVTEIFDRAKFIGDLGIGLVDLGPGWVETELVLQERHQQQNGFVHAGVQATIADHTAGGAAGTLVGPGEIILSAEFKIHLLRPGRGTRLRCRAEVLKPGRMFSIVESWVYGCDGEQETLIAKAILTMAVVKNPETKKPEVKNPI